MSSCQSFLLGRMSVGSEMGCKSSFRWAQCCGGDDAILDAWRFTKNQSTGFVCLPDQPSRSTMPVVSRYSSGAIECRGDLDTGISPPPDRVSIVVPRRKSGPCRDRRPLEEYRHPESLPMPLARYAGGVEVFLRRN
jgi:hypothetical protein